MTHLKPLIVAEEVEARIDVDSVVREGSGGDSGGGGERREEAKDCGYVVNLRTQVTRVRDDVLIAKGTHSIWIPDYLRM